MADSPESLQIGADALAAYSQLTREAYALFGAHHYDHYDFLLALSDHFGDIGLEHHRSSENRHDPNLFTEWNRTAPGRDLLAHEYVHSWNGKFRRPADLATANYNVPMQNSLLWVYEGMTDYWGSVLAARSGLWSAQQAREAWAETAAILNEARPGREWRSLSDTTMQPILAYKRRQPWFSWQRNTDYYSESQLIWLDVDTRIRELTRERRSLDDFAKAFCGIQRWRARAAHLHVRGCGANAECGRPIRLGRLSERTAEQSRAGRAARRLASRRLAAGLHGADLRLHAGRGSDRRQREPDVLDRRDPREGRATLRRALGRAGVRRPASDRARASLPSTGSSTAPTGSNRRFARPRAARSPSSCWSRTSITTAPWPWPGTRGCVIPTCSASQSRRTDSPQSCRHGPRNEIESPSLTEEFRHPP